MAGIQQRSISSELSEYRETGDVVIDAIRFIRLKLYEANKNDNYSKRMYLDISETLYEQEKEYNKIKRKCLTFQKTLIPAKKAVTN